MNLSINIHGDEYKMVYINIKNIKPIVHVRVENRLRKNVRKMKT